MIARVAARYTCCVVCSDSTRISTPLSALSSVSSSLASKLWGLGSIPSSATIIFLTTSTAAGASISMAVDGGPVVVSVGWAPSSCLTVMRGTSGVGVGAGVGGDGFSCIVDEREAGGKVVLAGGGAERSCAEGLVAAAGEGEDAGRYMSMC